MKGAIKSEHRLNKNGGEGSPARACQSPEQAVRVFSDKFIQLFLLSCFKEGPQTTLIQSNLFIRVTWNAPIILRLCRCLSIRICLSRCFTFLNSTDNKCFSMRASNACSLVLLVTLIYTIIIRLNNIIYILYCNLYSVFHINSIGVLLYGPMSTAILNKIIIAISCRCY